MERLEIMESLKDFPKNLEEEIAGLSDEVLSRRPGEGEWSIKEVLGHLVYAEEIWYRRLFQVWSLHDPVLMTFDDNAAQASIDNAYAASDISSYLEEIRAKRPRIIDLLVRAVDWTRTGQWLGEGRRSLKQLSEALLRHDQDHIAQIRALKALSSTGAST